MQSARSCLQSATGRLRPSSPLRPPSHGSISTSASSTTAPRAAAAAEKGRGPPRCRGPSILPLWMLPTLGRSSSRPLSCRVLSTMSAYGRGWGGIDVKTGPQAAGSSSTFGSLASTKPQLNFGADFIGAVLGFCDPTMVLRRFASSKSRSKPPSPSQPLPPPGSHSGMGASSQDMLAFMNALPFDDIPGPTAIYQTIPFAGTLALYYPFTHHKTSDMGSMLSSLQATYGPIIRVRIGMDWLVLIENLADIERVVQAAEQEDISRASWPQPLQHQLRRGPLKHFPFHLRPRVEDTALSWLDGSARSRKLRQAVAHHLSSSMVVDHYLHSQDCLAQDLVAQLDATKDSPQEIQTLCYRYAIESVVQMCLNERVGLLSDSYWTDLEKQRLVDSFRTVIRCLGETQTGTRVLHLLFEDPFARRFREAKTNINIWERQLMREATMAAIRSQGVQNMPPEERSLLISLLDDHSLSEQEIFDTVHGLMTTAAESVACSLQMLLFSLATNTDKQEMLVNDIYKAVGPDGPLTPRALDTLEYLKACVKESLRLNFPLCSGGRVLLFNNIVLSNYLIPSGTQIVVNSRRTARNPLWFEHPHFYLPERWTGEAARSIPPLAFMPFGFGATLCPSRTFALQELHAACVRIMQKFKVDLPAQLHGKKVETIYAPFRAPKEPLPFILTPRHGQPQGETRKPTRAGSGSTTERGYN